MNTPEILTDMAGIFAAAVDHYTALFRFVRRWRGGRWERWWIGPPFNSSIWCRMIEGEERPPLGIMCEVVEDYRPVPPALPAAGPYRTLDGRRTANPRVK